MKEKRKSPLRNEEREKLNQSIRKLARQYFRPSTAEEQEESDRFMRCL